MNSYFGTTVNLDTLAKKKKQKKLYEQIQFVFVQN